MKTLSERLEEEAASFKIIEWSEHRNVADDRHSDETKALLREAAALAKSVESAPVCRIEGYRIDWEETLPFRDWQSQIRDASGLRVALVPLPQQSET